MATKVTVNGKQFARPGIYSTIKSGITNPSLNLSYGNAVLLDTGIGAGFGGGSGINGENKTGINSVYEFTNIEDFRNFVKGGELWNLAEPLFRPETGVNGVSKLFFVKAASTTKGLKSLTFTNGTMSFATKDEGSFVNGVLTSSQLTKGYAMKLIASPKTAGKYILQFWMGTFKGLDSLNANAPYDNIAQANTKPVKVYESPEVSTLAELSTILSKDKSFNDAFTLVSTTIPPLSTLSTPVVGQFGLTPGSGGTFTIGTSRFFKVTAINSIGETLPSAEVSITTTATGDGMFLVWGAVTGATKYRIYKGNTTGAQNGYYEIPAFVGSYSNNALFLNSDSGTTAGTPPVTGTANMDGVGNIVSGDLITLSGYQLFAGGTETYETDLSNTIDTIKNLDFTHFLCTEYGTNAESANNTTIFEFLTGGTLKYEKYAWIGAGYDSSSFASSQVTTSYYDSPKINVVHGGGLKTDRTKVSGFRNVSSLWVTAAVMARTLGLEPQTPITFKSINLNGLQHNLSADEIEVAISKGLIYLNYDFELEKIVVGSGTNSMQTNDFLIDTNGDSYSISIERIKSQLNKELIFNGKRFFFGSENGANRNTVSEEDIKEWLKGFLTSKIATDNNDNLLITFDPADITIVRNQDTYYVTYSFVPNGEITKIVFTGFMLD